jgi:hypothetical protein
MRRLAVLTLLGLGLLGAGNLAAGGDRVVKVLPHLLDAQGRHALSPSLFERDAYQTMLKANPDKRGGLRFDVRWKAAVVPEGARALRLELVTTRHPRTLPLVVETPLPAKGKSGWAKVPLDAATAKAAGEIVAWRVSLVVAGEVKGSQQSFLW